MEVFLFLVVAILAYFVFRVALRPIPRDPSTDLQLLDQQLHDLRQQVSTLTRRIYELELRAVAAPTLEPVALAIEAEVQPIADPVEVPPLPDLSPTPEPLAELPPLLPDAEPVVPDFPLNPPTPMRAPEDWEALLGGNILAKIGALMAVIGIALLLGWWVPQLGPSGKVAVGFALSLAMLVPGLLIERRDTYRIPARALVAGGWAAAYFTTFAMHGLDGARVIDSPFVGLLALYAIAVAMTLFSLRYQSQILTASTFVIAFATLAIYPSSAFSLYASIPLTGFLLFVAMRRSWPWVAVVGALTAYASYLWQWYPTHPDPIAALVALFAYFVAFEAFDLLTARPTGRLLTPLLFPVNSAGFLIATLLPESPVSPHDLATFLTVVAALFLLSAVARARLIAPDPAPLAQITGFNGAVTVSCCFAFWAIGEHYTGLAQSTGFFVVAELAFLAGHYFARRYLRFFSAALLTIAAVSFLFRVERFAPKTFLGLQNWLPIVVICIAALYFNRIRLKSWPYHSWLALVLLTTFSQTLPSDLRQASFWSGYATVLLWLAFRETLPEGRYQAALLNFGVLTGVLINAWEAPLWASALPTLFTGVQAFLWLRRPVTNLLGHIQRVTASTAFLILAMTFADRALPSDAVGPAWALLAILWFGLAQQFAAPDVAAVMTWQVHALQLCILSTVFSRNFTSGGTTGPLSHRLLSVGPIAAAQYWLARQTNIVIPSTYRWSALLLILFVLRFELGRTLTVSAWATVMLVLLLLGTRLDLRLYRWQAALVGLAVFARCWATNFVILEQLSPFAQRLTLGVTTIAAFLAAYFLVPRFYREREDTTDRWLAPWFAILGSLLITVLLVIEVSGPRLTVALGLQGALTLIAGFLVRDRVIRILGLACSLAGMIKLFTFDIQKFDTPTKIVSFLGLGVLFIGASFLYARFKAKWKELL